MRPVSTDAHGRFLTHAVSAGQLREQLPARRRRRRDAEGQADAHGHTETLFYNVTVFGQELHMQLRLNSRLVAPGATVEWHDDGNGTRYEPLLPSDCLYVGHATNVPDTAVAISNCDGLVSPFSWALSSCTECSELFVMLRTRYLIGFVDIA